MKKIFILAVLLAVLTGCSEAATSDTSPISVESTSTSSLTSETSESLSSVTSDSSTVDSTLDSSIDSVTSSDVSSSSTESTDSSSSSVDSLVCETNPGTTNPDGTAKMAIPCNKNDKLVIAPSSDGNVNAMNFDFTETLPSGFRHIYGNNFTNPNYYALSNGGGIRFDQPRKGLQTPMFTTNNKLEIRLNIGSVNNNSKGNDIDKDKPVITIHGFDEFGTLLRSESIDTITVQDANKYKRVYMDGTDIAYLEVRLIQYAYKGSQAYNIAITGMSVTAWIYPLD